jgi:hypothetical protein
VSHPLKVSPSNQDKRLQRLKGWGFGAALVGFSFLPCPECGLPLGFHTWPFLLLFAVRQWVKERGVKCSGSREEMGISKEVNRTVQNELGK